jgi:eukaryotic-like serine/threonine-protein kinase
MFKFITHRPFWVNLLVIAALVALIIYFVLKMLGVITKHDAYLKVPAVLGKNTTQAVKLLEEKGFKVEITDSVYTDTASAGIVLKQLPDGNSTVKVNRTIFITVNRAIPPMIDMPKIEGQSLSFALSMLERSHLKLEDTLFRPDFQAGSVLEQQYKGVRIPEKAKVPWGSKITLVIGSGLGNRQFLVPSLVGMTLTEAKSYLEGLGITLASINAEANVKDTPNAYVYKQNPLRFNDAQEPNYIQAGMVMDVWLSKEKTFAKDSTDKK